MADYFNQQKIMIVEKSSDCAYSSKGTRLFINLKNTFTDEGYNVFDVAEHVTYDDVKNFYEDKAGNKLLLAFYIRKNDCLDHMKNIIQGINCSFIVYSHGFSFKKMEYTNLFNDIITDV